MDKTIHILILEDNPTDAELMEYELREAGFTFTSKRAMTEDAFVQGIEEFCPDVILSDYDLPQYNGAMALAEARSRCPDTPFILVTGAVSEDRAIEILTSGARDYVLKNRLNRLVPAVQRSLAESQEQKARKKAEEDLRKAHRELEATVRKRTEELRVSEERFRSIAEGTPVIMWMTYADGSLEFVNRAYREFFGVTLGQVIGPDKWHPLVHPDDVEAYVGAFASALRRHSAFHAQARVRRADGEWRWIESYSAPRLSSDGQFLGMAGSSPDITKRVQAERKLQESEEKFRTAFYTSAVPTVMTALNGRLMEVNAAFARMLSYSKSELVGMSFAKITHSDDIAANTTAAEPVIRGEKHSFRMQKRYLRKDGEIIWVDLTTASVCDARGKPLYFITQAQDITERKLAEEELRLKNFAFDASLASNSIADLDHTITQANAAFLRIWGYQSEDEVIGKSISDFFQNKAEAASIIEVLNGTGRWEDTFTAKKKDGSTFTAQGLATILTDANGKTIGYQSSVLDITERKEAEEELNKSEKLLRETNEELESFSYSVSHDLQAPLRAIKGFSHMILNDKERKPDRETKKRFSMIQENAEKMQRLIEDLLTLSRVGRQGVSLKILDMNVLVNDAWKEIEMAYPGKPLALKMKDLRPAYGDQTLIRQVLANLLSNAVKYSADRKPIEVEVGSYQENGGNVYYVKDQGAGFDMKYYDKLFGVFQRLHSASEFEGTGIGLSIAQRIIHLHGGKIWAEGKKGKGAVFYFMLPMQSLTS